MPKAVYDGVEVEVSDPRLIPIEWINFRCHPCTDWSGVDMYLSDEVEAAPILVCKDCFVVLDGWHRLASWWRRGLRYVWVRFADFHLGGAADSCHVEAVNWINTLRPWVDLDCVSGSYLESDFQESGFSSEMLSLRTFGDRMPPMRMWEHVRAMLFLGVLQGRKVLDVGTRESILPSVMAWRGANVTAIDLATEQIIPHEGVTIQVADATELPFDDCIFDNVVCTACIKHIPKDTLAVSEMLRVLKPHRLLAITFDFGQEYEELPGKTTGRRIYDGQSVYDRLVEPFEGVADICGPVNFGRSDWNDWPIKVQSPQAFAKGVNVQVGFVLLRKGG